jgi:hypothetical protein
MPLGVQSYAPAASPPVKRPVHVMHETGRDSKPGVEENIDPTGIRSPDRPAHSHVHSVKRKKKQHDA